MFGRGSEITKTGYESGWRPLVDGNRPERRDCRFNEAGIARAHLVDIDEDDVGERFGERRALGIGIEYGDEIVSRVGMLVDQLEYSPQPDEFGVAQPGGQKRASARRAVKPQSALNGAGHFARGKP